MVENVKMEIFLKYLKRINLYLQFIFYKNSEPPPQHTVGHPYGALVPPPSTIQRALYMN